MILAKEIMSKNVTTIHESASVYEALTLLTEKKISGIPVVDDEGKLVGILSEKDVLRIMIDDQLEKKLDVADYMTRNVISFGEEDNVVTICKFFINNNIRRVPIVKDEQIVGIVSRRDIIEAIIEVRSKMDALRHS